MENIFVKHFVLENISVKDSVYLYPSQFGYFFSSSVPFSVQLQLSSTPPSMFRFSPPPLFPLLPVHNPLMTRRCFLWFPINCELFIFLSERGVTMRDGATLSAENKMALQNHLRAHLGEFFQG